MSWLLVHELIWLSDKTTSAPRLVNTDHVQRVKPSQQGATLQFASDAGFERSMPVTESFEELQQLLTSDLKRARSSMSRAQLLADLRLPDELREELR